MNAYEFNVVLKELWEITDEQADAFYAAGCDDGTPTSRDGVAWVHFDREGMSLEEAIRSALPQIHSAGFAISKVEFDADSVGLASER